ncbi:MAG: MATE family efflux transporter [Erysipelotrichaceae bacterium]
MNLTFNESWSYKQFMKFVLPSILTMACVSFYSVVDSFFVANYVSTNAMASVNIVLPYTNLVWGIAVMLATGSSAIVGMKMGEKKYHEANQKFSFMTCFLLVLSSIMALICLFFIDEIVYLLGTSDLLFNDAKVYIFFLIVTSPILMIKLYFEYYVRLDGKPQLALWMSLVGLILNIIFDYVSVVHMNLGVLGASVSTALSIAISSLIGLYYFTLGKSHLKFCRFKLDMPYIIRSMFNGLGEMLTEMSSGIVVILFNISMMNQAGENGVAAIGVIMNIYYFFISIYMGISSGMQPVLSYNYGARNKKKMKEMLRQCFVATLVASILVFVIAQMCGNLIIEWYVSGSQNVIGLAEHGNRLFSFCYLFIGFNILVSGIYTSIGKGKVAALISLSRCVLFVLVVLKFLPDVIGIDGIWLAIPISELTTIALSTFFLYEFKKNYFDLIIEENL